MLGGGGGGEGGGVMDRQGFISLHQANGGHEANAANEGKGGSMLGCSDFYFFSHFEV